MPTYQYACTECDHAFEQVQSFSDDSLTVCPTCQGRLRKIFNAVGVVFKGSGFYRNDSRADAKATEGGSASQSGESGKSGKSEDKSGEKSGEKSGAKSGSGDSGSSASSSGSSSSDDSGSPSGSGRSGSSGSSGSSSASGAKPKAPPGAA